jgi:peptidoglycan/LPS O-acetylase OafA/YrhL
MPAMSAEPPPRRRFSGLDGLRAISVLLVLLFHHRHDNVGHSKLMPSFGWVGVQIFFVLSGYLISDLLLQRRHAPLGEYLREFYGRRALRIFPLYFATLSVLQVLCWTGLDLDHARAGMLYAWTYVFNFFTMGATSQHSEAIDHFWSLCVEEQFYLLWPFVIYFSSRERLRKVLVALVLAGPLIRLLLWSIVTTFPQLFNAKPEMAVYVNPLSHVDAFAVGALVALFPPRRALLGFALSTSVLLTAGTLVALFSDSSWDDTKYALGYAIGLRAGYGFIWGYSLLNIWGASLIACLVNRQLIPKFFENRSLSYLGKISYGIYILHYPLQLLVDTLFPSARLYVRLPIQLAATLGVATGSYYFLELPFLALKDRWFPSPVRHPAGKGQLATETAS